MSGLRESIRFPNPWLLAAGVALRTLRCGELEVLLPDGRTHRFSGREAGPRATIHVTDASVARRLLTGGSIALAETYMDGGWDTDDLNAVLRLGQANLANGWSSMIPAPTSLLNRLRHLLRDNDPGGGSRRNIAYHYDLGNDFYELWLDATMTYSSACFAEEDFEQAPGHGLARRSEFLERGQRRKWDRVLELLQPGCRDHILEIGCGWGGFALHAARESGCRVTGVTLSDKQAKLARERVREAGLDGHVEILLKDYREVRGVYSGVASIEMFEAVGEKWWPTFFRRLREALEPGHVAALQVITIDDQRFETYRRRVDFTQRYIFPGGMLPSPSAFGEAARAQGLLVGKPRFFGHDYATTLAAWAERFEVALPEVRRMGFDERFIRMWRYYLAYCRTGFVDGQIDVMQVGLQA